MISAPNQRNAFVDGNGLLTRYGLILMNAIVKRIGGVSVLSGDGNIADTLAEMQSSGVAQSVTPSSGDTVQMEDDAKNGFLRIRGSSPLASLVIKHPSDANSVDSQIRSIYFERAISSITWPNSSAMNLPTSCAAGDSITTQRLEPGLWMRRS